MNEILKSERMTNGNSYPANDRVSVVMAVHEGDKPELFSKAVASILAQNVQLFELIIVEDGPLTAELRQVIDKAQTEQVLPVKCISRSISGGPGLARNQGIAEARGSFIAIMDADDIAKPDRIAKQLDLLMRDGYDLVSSNYLIIDESDRVTGLRQLPETHIGIRKAICFYNPICNPAVLAKASVFKQYPYDHNLRFGEDYRLWMRLMQAGVRFGNHRESLIFYRQGPNFHAKRRGWKKASADILTKLMGVSLAPWYSRPIVIALALVTFFYRLLPSSIVKRTYELRRYLTHMLQGGHGPAQVLPRNEKVDVVPVAVILTTFKGYSRGFVGKAIESVLYQTAQPAEFVVIDDGSPDDTADWVKKNFPQVTVIHKPNGGPASARNFGIASTKSPFICFLDDDDIWFPEKLARQLAYMQATQTTGENVGIIFTALQIIDGQGQVQDVRRPAKLGYVWPDILLGNNILAPSSVMIRRQVFNDVGLFSEEKRHIYVEDYDFWIRASQVCRIDSFDYPLIFYREHGNQGSGNHNFITQRSVGLIRDHLDRHELACAEKIIAYHYYGAFFVALARGRRHEAIDFLRNSGLRRFYKFLFILRLMGVGLRFYRPLQRIWRRIEYWYVFPKWTK